MSSKPLDQIEIFIDRSLGRKIAEPILAAGAIVHLHDDHFDQGVDDEVWLTEVGKLGWAVLTKDKAIRYRTIEREALMNAGIRAFFFMSGNISFPDGRNYREGCTRYAAIYSKSPTSIYCRNI